jgi:hypothetical protein
MNQNGKAAESPKIQFNNLNQKNGDLTPNNTTNNINTTN